MRKLARLAIGAAALALVAAGASCGQQSPQEPRNQAQPSQTQQHQPQPSEAQQHQAKQAQDQAQPQNEAQPQKQAQQPEAQQPQPQNQAQPGQQSSNENSNQNVSQNTAENPSKSETRQIQQALEEKGFMVGRLDGKLGPKTKRALSQFQRKQGLQQTGMPDEQTLAALGIGGAANTTGQEPSGSGGLPSHAPRNNPSTQPPQ